MSTLQHARVFVAGHRGMVGSALVRALAHTGVGELILQSRDELDLLQQDAVHRFMKQTRPDIVIIAAARVGGILANASHPWEFLYENLVIESNLIGAAHACEVERLVFLGSSCIYPKLAPQPLTESSLLSGPLEPTNQAYAIAKISGLKLCEALHQQYHREYYSMMPTNLYGPNDNFDLNSSHVIPAMIRKFHEALPDHPVTLWGSGAPMREFMHVDDLANAVLFTLNKPVEHTLINVGTGTDLTIKELAQMIQSIVGHQGPIQWDTSKPDGTPRKVMEVSRLSSMGWTASIPLEQGLQETYQWFTSHLESFKAVSLE